MIDFIFLCLILLGPFIFLWVIYSLFLEIKKNYNNPRFYVETICFFSIFFLVVNWLNTHKTPLSCQKLPTKHFESIKDSTNHKISCLQRNGEFVVLFGESHAKSKKSWEEGERAIKTFKSIGIETSNLDEIPTWLSNLAWKERAVLDFIAYKVFGLKESSRDTAKKNKKVLDLEVKPVNQNFDKKYAQDQNLFKSYVITKRNFRIKHNILAQVSKEPLLVIVGKNHIKGLEELLKEEGFE